MDRRTEGGPYFIGPFRPRPGFQKKKESLSIEIINDHSKNIILNVVYRSPDGDLSITDTFLRKILSENAKANKTLFLAGDFNINVLGYENNKKVQNFVILCLNLA